MMVPGDVLLLCCAHNTNVIIKESFDKTFKTGKIQEIRELILELSEFIENYKSTKEITTKHIIKFYDFIDPGLFDE